MGGKRASVVSYEDADPNPFALGADSVPIFRLPSFIATCCASCCFQIRLRHHQPYSQPPISSTQSRMTRRAGANRPGTSQQMNPTDEAEEPLRKLPRRGCTEWVRATQERREQKRQQREERTQREKDEAAQSLAANVTALTEDQVSSDFDESEKRKRRRGLESFESWERGKKDWREFGERRRYWGCWRSLCACVSHARRVGRPAAFVCVSRRPAKVVHR